MILWLVLKDRCVHRPEAILFARAVRAFGCILRGSPFELEVMDLIVCLAGPGKGRHNPGLDLTTVDATGWALVVDELFDLDRRILRTLGLSERLRVGDHLRVTGHAAAGRHCCHCVGWLRSISETGSHVDANGARGQRARSQSAFLPRVLPRQQLPGTRATGRLHPLSTTHRQSPQARSCAPARP